nr:hypothetical protein [Clostridia bacterium]
MEFKDAVLWIRDRAEKAMELLKHERVRAMAIACTCALVVVVFGLVLKGDVLWHTDLPERVEEPMEEIVLNSPEEDDFVREPKLSDDDEKVQPKQPLVIDLSDVRIDLETEMVQINEPTPYGRELLYSAGNSSSIEGPVLTKLFLYNLDTMEQTQVAETKVKFGEIYEGRFNENWIVWLDTNQSGTNYIYALNRKTGEISQVKRCDLNKPQLVLYGDNLVWVEQKDEENDRMYLYNFKSGEPVILESFNNPTYGTCPPALYDDILVWVCPSPEDAGKSIIKKLDLKEALTIGAATAQDSVIQPSGDGPVAQPDDISANDTLQQGETAIEVEIVDVGGEGELRQGENQDDEIYEQVEAEVVEPQIIDPQGFAIYPQTNGQVIAWLDNLNPSDARLLMTRDDGKTIQVVAQGVGRLFGVGDKFIVYTQNDSIMLYFWEIDCYARLTKPDEKGMLSKACVAGNVVVWYDITDASQRKDKVRISIIEQPDI